MPQFKGFAGTNADLLAGEVNQLIASVLGSENTENYFDQFNFAVNQLNQLLTHPPSAQAFYHNAYQLQEEYNQLLLLEQHRCMNNGAISSKKKQVLKNLAQKKSKYNEALVLKKSFERRTVDINVYLSQAGWLEIIEQAKKVGSVEAVKKLKSDWGGQKKLAHFDSEDLMLLLNKSKDFQWFLKLISSVPTKNATILDILKYNATHLEKLNKQLTASIAWRLHAASLRGNLWFDDHLWALRYSLEQLIGLDFQIDSKIISQKLTPSIVRIFIKHLQKAQHSIDRDKWFNSRWISDPQNHYPIKVTLTEDLEMLPTVLMPLIPTKRSGLSEIFPDHFIRYFYFRGSNPKNTLEKCIKKKLIKEPYELIAFLNEATHQLNVLQENLNRQPTLVLRDVVQTPGFKSALLFPEIILQERNRMSKFQHTTLIMRGVSWVKTKVLGSKTEEFFLQWSEILSSIEQNVILQSKRVVSKIISNLEQSLVQEIKDNVFNSSKSLVNDLSRFVNYYGSHKKKAQFEKITSPVYLFQQFQFFIQPETELESSHQIDKEMIFVFLRYAALYWTPSQCQAAQAVVNILSGDFPKNEEEDLQFLLDISAWFTKRSKKRIYHFLNMLGLDFVVKIGARSDPFAYRFLEQYSTQGFKIWEKEREKDLNQKYFLLISALSRPLGSELDVEAQREQKIEVAFINDLKRDCSSNNYIAAVGEALKEYLKLYDGSNGHYAQFVLHLCGESNNKQGFDVYLNQYFILRLRYLVKNPQSEELTTQELSSYKLLCMDPIASKPFIQVLLDQDQAQSINLNIYSILCVLKNPEVLGVYLFKRMSRLVSCGLLDAIYLESDYFDKNKNNVYFNAKINPFFMAYLKVQYSACVEVFDSKLHWIIESYANQNVKEEARYIKIKQFLQYNSKIEVDDFLNECRDYIQGEDLSEMFTLESSKQRLAILYRDYNATMLEQRYWDGYAQYLMQNIVYPQTQACIAGAKVAWLNAVLFNLHPFFEDINKYLGEHPVIDVHMKNIQAPNDEISLSVFFGSEFLQVKNIIIQYLSQFEMFANDRKLKLITRYLEDDLFKTDEHWNILNDRLLVYKKVHEIMNNFINNEWVKGKQNLILLQDRQKGCRLLLANTQDKEPLHIKLQYYDTMLTALQKTAFMYCKPADLRSNGIVKLFQGPVVKNMFLSSSSIGKLFLK